MILHVAECQCILDDCLPQPFQCHRVHCQNLQTALFVPESKRKFVTIRANVKLITLKDE